MKVVTVVGARPSAISQAIRYFVPRYEQQSPFGDGDAGRKILSSSI